MSIRHDDNTLIRFIMKKVLLNLIMLMLPIIALAQTQKAYKIHIERPSGPPEFIVLVAERQSLIDSMDAQLQIPFADRQMIISGNIARGNGGFNLHWSWHFKTGEWGLVDLATEVCDAWPQFVEDNLDYFIDTLNGQFCPWASKVYEETTVSVASSDIPNFKIGVNHFNPHEITLLYNNMSDDEFIVTLTDINGKVISTSMVATTNNQKTLITIPPVSSGIYLITISTTKGMRTKKLIIQ